MTSMNPKKHPKRLAELPFDSSRKKMTVVIPHPQDNEKYLVLTKGAFDRLAPSSQHQSTASYSSFTSK